MQITQVLDLGNDVIEVHAVDDQGERVATGWVSAMTNHYDPAAYDADGNLMDGSTPRTMTDDEKHAYWLSLVTPVAAPAPEPVVLFEDPAAMAVLESAQAPTPEPAVEAAPPT